MRFYYTLLLMGLAAMLSGCFATSNPPPTVEYVLATPADHLLLDCPVAAPPSREVYKTAGVNSTREQAAEKREKLLTDHAAAQMKNMSNCNARWKALREWKTQQEALHKASSDRKGK